MSRLHRILAAMVLLTSSGPAYAVTFTANQPQTYSINFDGMIDQTVIPGLTAFMKYEYLSTVGNTWNFKYTLKNTSSAPIDASRVSVFGFDVNPNPIGATSGGAYTKTGWNATPSGGLDPADLCFRAGGGGQQCSGGGGGGTLKGQTQIGTFSLIFGSSLTQIELTDFFVRYQSIDSTSLGLSGASAVGVPGPIAGAGLPALFGLAGLLIWRRRRDIAA